MANEINIISQRVWYLQCVQAFSFLLSSGHVKVTARFTDFLRARSVLSYIRIRVDITCIIRSDSSAAVNGFLSRILAVRKRASTLARADDLYTSMFTIREQRERERETCSRMLRENVRASPEGSYRRIRTSPGIESNRIESNRARNVEKYTASTLCRLSRVCVRLNREEDGAVYLAARLRADRTA